MKCDEKLQVLNSFVEQTSEAVLITDSKYLIVYVNPAFTKLTGYQPEDVIGNNPKILSSGVHDIDFYRKMWHTLTKKKTTWLGKITDKRKDGSLYHASMSITPVNDQSDSSSEFTHFIAIQHDLDQVELTEE